MNIGYYSRVVMFMSIMLFSLFMFTFNCYADEVTLIDPFDLNIEINENDIEDSETTCVIVTEDEMNLNETEEVDTSTVLESVDEQEVDEVVNSEESHNCVSLGKFRLTSYCGCRECNGRWTGYPTASGTDYKINRTIAVDKRVIPLGTWVEINVLGKGWQKFRAEDTGSAVKGKHIDVYVGNHHSDCYNPYYNGYAEVRIVNS